MTLHPDHIPPLSSNPLIEDLRQILLEEDRKELGQIRRLLEDKQAFYGLLEPHLDAKLAEFRRNFPQEYERMVFKMIDKRIASSQEKIIEAIYPMLGALVKKFIQHQFDLLMEAIEAKVAAAKKTFNPFDQWVFHRSGVSEAEQIALALNGHSFEEAFILDRNSGLIVAHSSNSLCLDAEASAGLFTALKHFAEDALKREKEELDFIRYQNSMILLETYANHFLAIVIVGQINERERRKLSRAMHKFMTRLYPKITNLQSEADREELMDELKTEFLS